MPPELMNGMNWFGLVAGWIVVFSPLALAAFATAVPILWNSDPGFEVAIPTVCAAAGPPTSAATLNAAAVIKCFIRYPPR